MEGGAWFLARWPDGSFDLHRVTAPFARPLVAVRTIAVSPFPGEAATLYLGGFDANKVPAHDTAWVVRSTLAEALGRVP